MALSLDGFVSRRDHSLDWLMKYGADESDKSFELFTKGMDALVMGSGTYKTVLGFDRWPYKMPVYVMSGTLSPDEVPDSLKDKVRIKASNPEEIMRFLYDKGLERVYVDGGKLVQSFIAKGLIEEITLTQIPILIGDGKRLFGAIQKDIDLELIKSTPLKFGFVQSHYRLLTNR